MSLYGVSFIIAFVIFAYFLHDYITIKTTEHHLNRYQYKETYYPEPNILIAILVGTTSAILTASTLYFLKKKGFTITAP